MGKRKTYQEKIDDLNAKAKEEIYQMLYQHDLREFQMPDGVYVLSQKPGADFEFCRVAWVGFINEGHGDVLCFDYVGGIAWYQNPIIWCQICDAMKRALK